MKIAICIASEEEFAYDWGMITIDLFSGAGGLSLGLKQAGMDVVISNELEKDFAETYRKNSPSCRMINKNIYDIDFGREAGEIGLSGKVDLVAGGPPCQGFSTVGRKDKNDVRNSLFEQFLRVVSETKPRYVLFENVSGFKRLYEGIAYKGTVEGLSSMGYEYVSGVLNAMDYGLPQSRQRTIILAWREGENPVFLPTPTHGSKRKPFLTLLDAISDLPPIGTGLSSSSYLCNPQNEYQKLLRGSCTVLTEHFCAKYGDRMKSVISKVPPGGSIMDVPVDLRPKGYFKNTYARLVPDSPSPTMTRNFGTPSSSRCIHPFQDRALSTREGARLQGFPDSYIFHGGKGSKNLQIGNAVPVVLARVLGESISSAAKGQ